MKIVRALEPPLAVAAPLYVAAGMFDGVHRGHQAVIGAAVEAAAREGGEAWVLTFDPHPLAVINPDRTPPNLTPLPRRLELIEALGIDGILVVPFTRAFSHLDPDAFLAALHRAFPTLRQITVGPDWRFGRNAAGDTNHLRRLAPAHGFEAVIAPNQQHQGAKISSTAIRDAIREGRFEEAGALLGRPFSVFGTVVAGRQVGRKLGFPTANIVPDQDVLPPHGVFAVQVAVNGRLHPGAAYYGHRSLDPERDQQYVLESFLFDMEEDLYGKPIEVRLLSFIRPDQRFDSEAALKAQITQDTKTIRSILTGQPPGPETTKS